jgi:hypothetical protein
VLEVRRSRVDLPVFMALPEQPVVVKLEWPTRIAGWERQRRGIAGAIATSERRLDWTHVEHRVRELWPSPGQEQAQWTLAEPAPFIAERSVRVDDK